MNFRPGTQRNPLLLFCLIALSYWHLAFLPPADAFVLIEEICNNALDDDEDGLVDLNDPDCICEVIEPVSLIQNPSFEDMDCCPEDRSQLDCASGWIQASEPTTDYLHQCGWMGWEDFPPPLPFPDGEGVMGFRDGRVRNGHDPEPGWKEYAGSCLLSPLQAGVTYRFEFYVGFVDISSSPPINITFFGTQDCDNLPFGVGEQLFGCPTNGAGWAELGNVMVSGGIGNKWLKTSIEVTPETPIAAIAIGPSCSLSQNPTSTYYFFDNLVLADEESFDFRIFEITHPCDEDYLLAVPYIAEYTYQWYRDGVALIGETSNELTQMYGLGDYAVKIIDNFGECSVSESFPFLIPVYSTYLSEKICLDDDYFFDGQYLNESGQYVDTLISVDGCDSIVFLDLEVLGFLSDTISAKIFEGEQFHVGEFNFNNEGDYIVTLPSSLGCDSIVFLGLSLYNVFTPNVFSPNDDGINDVFTILAAHGDILDRDLFVYDRWGSLVFRGTEWDGKIGGEPANPGVFTYVFQILMEDGIKRQFSGTVTLLR